MTRRPYPTDLSDAEWAILAPLLPAAKPGGRPRSTDLREVMNALRYWLRSGEAWRLVAPRLPAVEDGVSLLAYLYWRTCTGVPVLAYLYWRTWRLSGDWERMHAVLRARVRVRAGREPTPSAGIIDSQSVKTTEKGGLQTRAAPTGPRR